MSDFPEILIEGRNKLEVSQEDFAALIPMDRNNYIGVEKGRKFLTEKQLKSVSKLIKYDYAELFRIHEEWEIQKRPEKAKRVYEEAKFLPAEMLLDALKHKVGDKREFDRLLKKLEAELG